MLKRVGLDDRRTHRPSELSGGQQQRVAIARALVSRPTVVFADEPTGNLDSKTGGEILELMRESVDAYGQTTVMVTHEARAAAIADRILFLADGLIVKELPRSQPPTSSRRWSRSPRRDEVRPEGAARPQAADGPDRDRDRARRRDGERHVRPHRLDRQGVRRDLHRGPRGLGRRRHRQVGLRPLRRQRQRRRRRSTSRCSTDVRELPEVQDAEGGVDGETTNLIDRDGKAIARRRAEHRLQRRQRRLAVQSADARRGRLAGGGRGRDRRGDRRQEGLRRSARRSACRPRARSRSCASPGSSGSASRCRRSAAPPSPASTSRPRRRSSARRASSTRSRSQASPDVSPEQLLAEIEEASRRPRRCGRAQPGDRGRRGDERVHHLPPGLPARVRRHRALRRQLRDRELALDHDRAAHARVRDAPDDRRLAAPGARLDRDRGARDRHRRLGRRAVPRARARQPASSSSSTPSASRCRTAGSSSRPRTIVVALLVGILVTLVASLRPAIRATRVPPIAAVREGATLPESRFARYRTLGSAILTVAGFAALAVRPLRPRPRHDRRAPLARPRRRPHLLRRRAPVRALHPPARRVRSAGRRRASAARRGRSPATTRGGTRSGPRRRPRR